MEDRADPSRSRGREKPGCIWVQWKAVCSLHPFNNNVRGGFHLPSTVLGKKPWLLWELLWWGAYDKETNTLIIEKGVVKKI